MTAMRGGPSLLGGAGTIPAAPAASFRLARSASMRAICCCCSTVRNGCTDRRSRRAFARSCRTACLGVAFAASTGSADQSKTIVPCLLELVVEMLLAAVRGAAVETSERADAVRVGVGGSRPEALLRARGDAAGASASSASAVTRSGAF